MGAGLICLVLCLLVPRHAFPIKRLYTTNPKAFAMGNSYSLGYEMINPGGLSFVENPGIGIAVLNQFQMAELNTASLYVMYPNRWLDAGLRQSAYGFEDYRILQSQAALSKKITANLSLGVNFIYSNQSSIVEEIDQNNLYADIGLLYLPTPKWELALLIENGLHTEDKKLTRFNTGASFKAFDNTRLSAQIAWDYLYKWNLAAGLEYELIDSFIVRGGYQSIGKSPTFGVGYTIWGFEMNAGFMLHSTLGVSSMIGINYRFGL